MAKRSKADEQTIKDELQAEVREKQRVKPKPMGYYVPLGGNGPGLFVRTEPKKE